MFLISSHKLASTGVQATLYLTWPETPKTGFLEAGLNRYVSHNIWPLTSIKQAQSKMTKL